MVRIPVPGIFEGKIIVNRMVRKFFTFWALVVGETKAIRRRRSNNCSIFALISPSFRLRFSKNFSIFAFISPSFRRRQSKNCSIVAGGSPADRKKKVLKSPSFRLRFSKANRRRKLRRNEGENRTKATVVGETKAKWRRKSKNFSKIFRKSSAKWRRF